MHFFSRSGNFNSIWQLLHFQDNPVTVSGYRQGWGSGTERKNLVACWNWVEMLSWSVSTNKLERNKPVIVLLSVTEGPKWCGCDERGGGRKKKRRRKWVLWTQKQLVNSVRFSLLSNGLIRSLILSQMTPQGAINSLFYPLKMRHQSNHF